MKTFYLLTLSLLLCACDMTTNHQIKSTSDNAKAQVMSNSAYFNYSDFTLITQPFIDGKCNYHALLTQSKNMQASNNYRYLYSDDDDTPEPLDKLSDKEKCLLLSANQISAYDSNDKMIFDKAIKNVSQNDMANHQITKFHIYNSHDFTHLCLSVEPMGAPFSIRYTKENGVIARTIVSNDDFNFECAAVYQ